MPRVTVQARVPASGAVSTPISAEFTVGAALSRVRPEPGGEKWSTLTYCAHPTFGGTTYDNDAWVPLLADMNAAGFRGLYAQNLPHCMARLAQAKTHGLKWLMLTQSLDGAGNRKLTNDALLTRLRHIRDNAHLECEGLEGINEPFKADHPFTVARAEAVIETQFLLWKFVRENARMSHVKVVSASLHAVNSGEDDHRRLAEVARDWLARKRVEDPTGWNGAGSPTEWWHLFHYAGLHRYSGAREPGYLYPERLGWIATHWGDPDVWVTETGFHNLLTVAAGKHNPISELGANLYSLRNWLPLMKRWPKVKRVTRYEFLNDPTGDHEAHFGLIRTPGLDPATWTLKPEYATIRNALALLKDAPGYVPPEIGLHVEVPAGVELDPWTLTKTRTGAPVLWLSRPVSVWDITTDQDIIVPPVDIRVHTDAGVLDVPVAGGMVPVTLAA